MVIHYQSRPFGRFFTDGPQSGEAFREDVLVPFLEAIPGKLEQTIDMTGYNRYGPSWIEEVFGGLRRNHSELLRRVTVIPKHNELPSLVVMANKCMEEVKSE